MKRLSVLVVVALFAVAVIFFAQSLRKTKTVPTNEGNLTLTNMPSQYCPKRAWVVIARSVPSTIIVDRDINVDNCRYIQLKKYLGTSGEYSVYVHVPNALAFRFEITAPINGVVEYPVQLGDVNADNAIDASDEKLVTQYLFSESTPKYDVTGDKQITIDDVSMVRLNQGVGVERPDKIKWAGSTNE